MGTELGYKLIRSYTADALFVREELVPTLFNSFPEVVMLLNRTVLEHFNEGTLCHSSYGPQLRSRLMGSADVRAWANVNLPLEARAQQVSQLLRADEAGSCGRGVL